MCGCGRRGCLEAYASAGHLFRRYRQPSGRSESAERVAKLAVSGGDPSAEAVWQEAIEALAMALSDYALLLEPELVVLAGGLAGEGDALFEPLQRELDGQMSFGSAPSVGAASLGADAGCLGAALVAFRAAKREEFSSWFR